jgi:hypothetical protein
MTPIETMAKEASLTQKQKDFFKYIAMGYSRAESGRLAGYKEPRASAMVNTRNYTSTFREAFAKAGYSIGNIVEDVITGTKADKVISAVNSKPANGQTMDFIDVPDWNARHKFIDSAIKLQDFYPSQKLADTMNVQMNFATLMQQISNNGNKQED